MLIYDKTAAVVLRIKFSISENHSEQWKSLKMILLMGIQIFVCGWQISLGPTVGLALTCRQSPERWKKTFTRIVFTRAAKLNPRPLISKTIKIWNRVYSFNPLSLAMALLHSLQWRIERCKWRLKGDAKFGGCLPKKRFEKLSVMCQSSVNSQVWKEFAAKFDICKQYIQKRKQHNSPLNDCLCYYLRHQSCFKLCLVSSAWPSFTTCQNVCYSVDLCYLTQCFAFEKG